MASGKGIVYIIYNTAINQNGAKSLELFNQGYDLLRYDLYPYLTNAGFRFEKDYPDRSTFNLADQSSTNLSNYRNYTGSTSIDEDNDSLKGLYSSSYLPFEAVIHRTNLGRKQYLPVVTTSDLNDIRKTMETLHISPAGVS
jgi:hypothetical protein